MISVCENTKNHGKGFVIQLIGSWVEFYVAFFRIFTVAFLLFPEPYVKIQRNPQLHIIPMDQPMKIRSENKFCTKFN